MKSDRENIIKNLQSDKAKSLSSYFLEQLYLGVVNHYLDTINGFKEELLKLLIQKFSTIFHSTNSNNELDFIKNLRYECSFDYEHVNQAGKFISILKKNSNATAKIFHILDLNDTRLYSAEQDFRISIENLQKSANAMTKIIDHAKAMKTEQLIFKALKSKQTSEVYNGEYRFRKIKKIKDELKKHLVALIAPLYCENHSKLSALTREQLAENIADQFINSFNDQLLLLIHEFKIVLKEYKQEELHQTFEDEYLQPEEQSYLRQLSSELETITFPFKVFRLQMAIASSDLSFQQVVKSDLIQQINFYVRNELFLDLKFILEQEETKFFYILYRKMQQLHDEDPSSFSFQGLNTDKHAWYFGCYAGIENFSKNLASIDFDDPLNNDSLYKELQLKIEELNETVYWHMALENIDQLHQYLNSQLSKKELRLNLIPVLETLEKIIKSYHQSIDVLIEEDKNLLINANIALRKWMKEQLNNDSLYKELQLKIEELNETVYWHMALENIDQLHQYLNSQLSKKELRRDLIPVALEILKKIIESYQSIDVLIGEDKNLLINAIALRKWMKEQSSPSTSKRNSIQANESDQKLKQFYQNLIAQIYQNLIAQIQELQILSENLIAKIKDLLSNFASSIIMPVIQNHLEKYKFPSIDVQNSTRNHERQRDISEYQGTFNKNKTNFKLIAKREWRQKIQNIIQNFIDVLNKFEKLQIIDFTNPSHMIESNDVALLTFIEIVKAEFEKREIILSNKNQKIRTQHPSVTNENSNDNFVPSKDNTSKSIQAQTQPITVHLAGNYIQFFKNYDSSTRNQDANQNLNKQISKKFKGLK